MIISINGEVLEEFFCQIHKQWHQWDDEMNCCQIEIEGDDNV